MAKKKKSQKKTEKKPDEQYAHNPDYCMIYPDADDRDSNVVSGSQS